MHKYTVGKVVTMKGDGLILPQSGRYEVVRLLPPDIGGMRQYRLKSVENGQERVARESELFVDDVAT